MDTEFQDCMAAMVRKFSGYEEARRVIVRAAAWNKRDASQVTTVSLQNCAQMMQRKRTQSKRGRNIDFDTAEILSHC